MVIAYVIFFRSISREDLQDYIKTHYKAPRVVLAGAGGVDHNELVKLAETHFKKLDHIDGPVPDVSPCRYTGKEIFVWSFELSQSIFQCNNT